MGCSLLGLYSAYNHKRAIAAKCRESHQRRTDATTAVPFPDSGGVTHGIFQRWRAYDCTHCISSYISRLKELKLSIQYRLQY
jgi:hypothetical protein